MGVQLVSTDFKSHEYYSNIRKAITAGYFMQVSTCTLLPAMSSFCCITSLLASASCIYMFDQICRWRTWSARGTT